ncbi:hypothetical protein GQ53DRAFT_804550 [Thozetella sp. PMI_491]|nr:hypothetical protein GQ53DRAFT_804550 [Thozetella sp. PMI_491]
MNTAALSKRPLGCLKTSLRRARQQKQCRFLATAATTASPSPPALPDHNFYRIRDPKNRKIRTAFAVYAPQRVKADPSAPVTVTSTRLPPLSPNQPPPGQLFVAPKDPLPALHAAQIRRMDPAGQRTALFDKTNRDCVRVGDILMVTHRRGGEPFAGVCMSIRRAGIDTSILLRSQLTKVGVERWFKVYNKNVAGIEIVKRQTKRARRARLTYLRKPKHDIGSVHDVVFAWKKTRNVLTTRGGASATTAKGKKA